VSDSKLAPENTTKKETGITSQRLNLILAICAILISAASFYATYLQASAAEKQVKAMTLPLVQYENSNLDDETKKPVIIFSIVNGGVGPASIKSLNITYKNESYHNIYQVLKACCASEYEKFIQKVNMDMSQGGYITSSVVNRIIPAQEEIQFYRLYDGEISHALWQKLNTERSDIKVSICYCSLLDECYITTKNREVESVQSCPVEN